MALTKISATLSPDLIASVRQRAGERGVSSWLDSAVREKLQRDERRDAVLALLAELDAEDPPTDSEREQARRDADRLMNAEPS